MAFQHDLLSPLPLHFVVLLMFNKLALAFQIKLNITGSSRLFSGWFTAKPIETHIAESDFNWIFLLMPTVLYIRQVHYLRRSTEHIFLFGHDNKTSSFTFSYPVRYVLSAKIQSYYGGLIAFEVQAALTCVKYIWPWDYGNVIWPRQSTVITRRGRYWTKLRRSVILPIFSPSSKPWLPIKHHIHNWEVSPQLSYGGTCGIWMWFKRSNESFKISSTKNRNQNPRSLFAKPDDTLPQDPGTVWNREIMNQNATLLPLTFFEITGFELVLHGTALHQIPKPQLGQSAGVFQGLRLVILVLFWCHEVISLPLYVCSPLEKLFKMSWSENLVWPRIAFIHF